MEYHKLTRSALLKLEKVEKVGYVGLFASAAVRLQSYIYSHKLDKYFF